MKVILDTSSLLSLVRYYYPFDKSGILIDFIKSEIENKNFIIIDAVYNECKYISQGLILSTFNFLQDVKFQKDNKLPVNTKDLTPPATKKFYNLLENNFSTPLSRKLTDPEFVQQRQEYLETADARMIILALIYKTKNQDVAIVTEESKSENDNKYFKKFLQFATFFKYEFCLYQNY